MTFPYVASASFRSLATSRYKISYSLKNNLSRLFFTKPYCSVLLPDRILSIYSINCNGCNIVFLLNTMSGNVLTSLNFHSRSPGSLITRHRLTSGHGLDFASIKIHKSCRKNSHLPTYQFFVFNKLNFELKCNHVISIGHNLHYKGLFRPFRELDMWN